MKKLTESQLQEMREIDDLIDDTLVDALYIESLNEAVLTQLEEAAPACPCCKAQMRVVRDDDITPPHGLLFGLYVPTCECWACPCDSGAAIPQPKGTACRFCGHAQGSCDCVRCHCGWRHPRGFVCERPPLPDMPF